MPAGMSKSKFLAESVKEISAHLAPSLGITSSSAKQSLQPVTSPSVLAFPQFTATKTETFVIKETNSRVFHQNLSISFEATNGKPGPKFLEIDEVKSDIFVFKTAETGEEVMRIKKKEHLLSSDIYHGLAPDGTEKWTISVKRHTFDNTEYFFKLHPEGSDDIDLSMANEVIDDCKVVLYNDKPVSIISRPKSWKHVRRQDHVQVAEGFDILVALGAAWVHYDKQKNDDSIVEEVLMI